MPTTNDVRTWRGQDVLGSDGEKLGTLEEIYLDSESGDPEWALVTTGMFGTKQSFVPLRSASQSGDGVTVPFDKATVKESPQIDPDGELTVRSETLLHRHPLTPYLGARLRGTVEATYVRGTLAFDRRTGPAAIPAGQLLLPTDS